MGHAEDALKLFLTENIIEANNITSVLEKYNRERQDIERKIFEQAIEKIESNNLNKNNALR